MKKIHLTIFFILFFPLLRVKLFDHFFSLLLFDFEIIFYTIIIFFILIFSFLIFLFRWMYFNLNFRKLYPCIIGFLLIIGFYYLLKNRMISLFKKINYFSYYKTFIYLRNDRVDL